MSTGALRVGVFRVGSGTKTNGAVPFEVRLGGVQTYRLVVDDTEVGLFAVDLDQRGVAGIAQEVRHRVGEAVHPLVRIRTDAGEVHAVGWIDAWNEERSVPAAVWVDGPNPPGPEPSAPLVVRPPVGSGVDGVHLEQTLRELERRWGGVDGPGFELGPPHQSDGVVWITPGGHPPADTTSVRISIHIGGAPLDPDFTRADLVADVAVQSAAAATAWIESLFVTTFKDHLPLPQAVLAAHGWRAKRAPSGLRLAVPPTWHHLRVVRIPPWPGAEPWHLGWNALYPGRWESLPHRPSPNTFAGLHVVVGPAGSGRTSFVLCGLIPAWRSTEDHDLPGYTHVRAPTDFDHFFRRLDSETKRQVAILDGVASGGDPRLADWRSKVARAGERGALVVVGSVVPDELRGTGLPEPYRLTLPDRADLLRVLEAPAVQVGYSFEDGVLEAVVDDVIARAPADRLREASERLRDLWAHLDGFVFSAASVARAEAGPENMAVASLASDQAFDSARAARDQDQLDFWRHVEAFTSLILSRQTRLPLSVGLFGDWGSGKSFFMRSLSQALVGRARAVQDTSPDPADWTHWHGRVVPIHFNAWHFADSDLWASLVHHLFRELGAWLAEEDAGRESATEAERQALAEQERERVHLAMLQKLQTTQNRVREATAARDALRERLQAEQARRDSALAQGLLGLKHAATVFVTDIKTDLEADPAQRGTALTDAERADVVEMVELAGEAEAVRTLLGERSPKNVDEIEQLVRDWSGWQRAVRYGSWLLRGPRPWARLGFMLGLVFVAYLFHNLVDFMRLQSTVCAAMDGGPWYCGALAPTASTLAWILSTTATTWGLFQSWLQRTAPGLWGALAKPERFEARLKTFHELLPRFKADRRAAARALDDAEASVAAAQRQLQEAERALQEARSGVALRRFVTDRAGDRYRTHLGLMSTIDEDLDQLAHILAELELDFEVARRRRRGEVEPDRASLQPPPAPRIVLFIDDLDRCPPERVVDVLEAVHLLLAKDLFAVVVAVDARWLMRSVDTHFRSLVETASDHQHPRVGDPLRVATPRHYLEKIFQVPFQVPPMSAAGYSRLVDRLVGDLASEDVEPRHPTAHAKPAPGLSESPPEVDASPPMQQASEPATADPGPSAVASAAVAVDLPAKPLEPPPSVLPEAVQVQFSRLERDVLRALAPLVRTPRSTKRLVNTARLVRLHAGGDPDWPDLCPVTLLLLGLEVGAWETWVATRQRLIACEYTDPLECVQRVAASDTGRSSGLSRVLQYLSGRPGLSNDPRRWRRAMELSERYAFVLDGGHTTVPPSTTPGRAAGG